MSNEKMQILKMLEEGKISADEASRLLQSVGTDSPSYESPASNSQNRAPAGSSSGSSVGRSFSGFEDFAGDLGRKFETLAKDMEPKIQKFVGVVAEKTADMADKISRNINDVESKAPAARPAPSPSQPGRSPAPTAGPSPAPASPSPATASGAPRNFELKVDAGYNELSLTAFNGDISVNGYNGDKITVRVYAKERRSGARLELMRLGSRYYLSYDEDDFKSVSIDALVPERMFNSVVLGATGGRTEVTNISAEYFTIQSSNGALTLRQIRSDNIKADTSNGKISLENISAQNAHIEGGGGTIDANYLDIANMHLITSNGAIAMNAADLRQASDYTWIIESSNGKIALNVPSSPRIGYHVRANTSLGNVRLGLPGLNYAVNTPNSVEARSAGYDSAACRVKISVETSNAGLSIN